MIAATHNAASTDIVLDIVILLIILYVKSVHIPINAEHITGFANIDITGSLYPSSLYNAIRLSTNIITGNEALPITSENMQVDYNNYIDLTKLN